MSSDVVISYHLNYSLQPSVQLVDILLFIRIVELQLFIRITTVNIIIITLENRCSYCISDILEGWHICLFLSCYNMYAGVC